MGKFCVKCGAELNENGMCENCNKESETPAVDASSDANESETQKTSKKEVNNVLIWIVAFAPVIGTFFAFGFLAFLIFNMILTYFDEKEVKKADTIQHRSATPGLYRYIYTNVQNTLITVWHIL